MTIAIDPQIAGVLDDGSAEGVVRTKLTQSGLAMVPFRPGSYTNAGAGFGSVTASNPDNPDGSNSGLQANISPQNSTWTSNLGLQYETWAYGARIGIYWKSDQPGNPNGTISPSDFGVMIDGVSYVVQARDLIGLMMSQTAPVRAGMFLVEDLPERDASGRLAPHHIRTVHVPDPAAYSQPIITSNADQIHFTIAHGAIKPGYCTVAGINNYVLGVAQGAPNDIITLLTPTSATPGQNVTQGGFTRITQLYGLLLESRLGYFTPPPRCRLVGQGAGGAPAFLTASQADLNLANLAFHFPAFRQLIYLNTDNVPRTVTITWAGTTFWTTTIPAGQSQAFDPGALVSNPDISFQHACDVTNKVSWMAVMGGAS